METFKFSANFRLRHPSMDPQVITAAMGLEPSNFWCIGQDWPARHMDGTKIGSGLRTDSYWTSLPRRGEDEELIEVLKSDLVFLEQKRQFVKVFIATSGRFTYYISWFASDRSGGEELHWSLLKRFGDLQINLSLDVYSAWRETETPPVIGSD